MGGGGSIYHLAFSLVCGGGGGFPSTPGLFPLPFPLTPPPTTNTCENLTREAFFFKLCCRVDEDEDEEDMVDAPPDEEDLKLENAAFIAGDIAIYVYTYILTCMRITCIRTYTHTCVYTYIPDMENLKLENAAFIAGDIDIYVYTYIHE